MVDMERLQWIIDNLGGNETIYYTEQKTPLHQEHTLVFSGSATTLFARFFFSVVPLSALFIILAICSSI